MYIKNNKYKMLIVFAQFYNNLKNKHFKLRNSMNLLYYYYHYYYYYYYYYYLKFDFKCKFSFFYL